MSKGFIRKLQEMLGATVPGVEGRIEHVDETGNDFRGLVITITHLVMFLLLTYNINYYHE